MSIRGNYFRGKSTLEIDLKQILALLEGAALRWNSDGKVLYGDAGQNFKVMIGADNDLVIHVRDDGDEHAVPIAIYLGDGQISAVELERRVRALRKMYA